MAAKSKVKALPGPIRAALDKLLNTGRFTLDEIVAHMLKLAEQEGIPAEALPSRSSIGRYALDFNKVAARLREAKEVAEGLVEKLGVNATGEVGRLLSELLKTVAFQTLGEMSEAGADAKDVMFLSAALKNLASTGKIDAEARAAIHKVAREEALAEAEQAVEQAKTTRGLSEDAYKVIHDILAGVKSSATP